MKNFPSNYLQQINRGEVPQHHWACVTMADTWRLPADCGYWAAREQQHAHIMQARCWNAEPPQGHGTRANPWDVRTVRACNGGISVELVNHYCSEPEFWRLSAHSFADPKFLARRYTFHAAEWREGSREAFARVVRGGKAIRASREAQTQLPR